MAFPARRIFAGAVALYPRSVYDALDPDSKSVATRSDLPDRSKNLSTSSVAISSTRLPRRAVSALTCCRCALIDPHLCRVVRYLAQSNRPLGAVLLVPKASFYAVD